MQGLEGEVLRANIRSRVLQNSYMYMNINKSLNFPG